MKETAKEKVKRLLSRSNNYFYRYILTKEKTLFDKYLKNSKVIIHLIDKWN